eukprot:1873220-Pyramimonas_sp.AAC.1
MTCTEQDVQLQCMPHPAWCNEILEHNVRNDGIQSDVDWRTGVWLESQQLQHGHCMRTFQHCMVLDLLDGFMIKKNTGYVFYYVLVNHSYKLQYDKTVQTQSAGMLPLAFCSDSIGTSTMRHLIVL